VADAQEIRGVEVTYGAASADVHITVAWERFTQLLQRRRNLTGRTGCGLCGQSAPRMPSASARRCRPASASAPRAARGDRAAGGPAADQCPHRSVHAAAWVVPGEGIKVVREDVGRHNALDKTIGALSRAHADFTAGYMLITSRASYEMVQKCAPSDLVAGGAVGADGLRSASGAARRAHLVAFARAISTSSTRTRTG